MRRAARGPLAAALLMGLMVALLPPGSGRAQERAPLPVDGEAEFYQRVLTLPGASLQAAPDAGGRVIGRPAVFSIYYVYDRRQAGGRDWVQVGADAYGRVDGWLAADQVQDWSTMLVMEYTPVGQRRPVLFFDEAPALSAAVNAADPQQTVAGLLTAARRGSPEGGVVSFEEARGVTGGVGSTEGGYLMPILDFERTEVDATGVPVTLLKIASLNSEAEAQQRRIDEANRRAAEAEREALIGQALQNFRIGIVFVVDTTISMGPYIERVRDAVRVAYEELRAGGLLDRTSFGLVAFRSDMSREPQKSRLEYETRIFQKLEPGADPGRLVARLGEVHEATVSTHDFSEDAVAGLYEAINDMSWDSFDARFVILVTDAGALRGNDPRAKYQGVDILNIRELAAQKNIGLFPVHLISAEAERAGNVAGARQQYQMLGQVDGQTSNYRAIPAESFDKFLDQMRSAMGNIVAANERQDEGILTERVDLPLNPDPETVDIGRLITNQMFNAEQRYIGRIENNKVPQFFAAWASDKDLQDPDRLALKVSVFLTRNQLNELGQRLDAIIAQAKAASTSPETFFDLLQSLAAATAQDPGRHGADYRSIAELGLLPAYLSRLPYTTELLDMRPADWLNKGFTGQQAVIDELIYKSTSYRDIAASDVWKDLGAGDRGLEVHAVPFSLLP